MTRYSLYYRNGSGYNCHTSRWDMCLMVLNQKTYAALGNCWRVKGGGIGHKFVLSCLGTTVGKFYLAQDCYEAIRACYHAQQNCHL